VQVDALAFGPHPDDVELGMGGTLLKLAAHGHRAAIVDLTAGEMGTRGERPERALEAEEAARILKAQTRRTLDLGDGRLAADFPSKVAVVEVIRELRPRLVFTCHWDNVHPDHAAAGTLVAEAAYLAGLGRFEAKGEPHRPNRVLFYMPPHRAPPSFIVDVTDFYQEKLRAIRAYRSQLFDARSTAPATFISRPEFLDEIEGAHRYYGSLIGAGRGEPFYLREALSIDDPLSFFTQPFTRFT